MFVSVGQNGARVSSTDGVEWKNQQIGKEGETYRSVAHGNGVFAAVGGYGYGNQLNGMTTDGIEWKVMPKANAPNYRSVFFGDGKFLALGGDPGQVGDAKPVVAISSDGVEYTAPKRISGNFILRRLAFGNKVFVGVGDRGRRSFSADGLEWKDSPNNKAVDTLVDIAFGGSFFVGVGLHGLRMRSYDGVTWSEPQRANEGEHLNSIIFANGHFVAIGAGVTFKSYDGEKWERQENQGAPLICAYGAGAFVGLDWKGRILHSPDGVQWKEVYKCPHNLEAVTFGG